MPEKLPVDRRTAPEIIRGIQRQIEDPSIQSATGILKDILIVDQLAKINGESGGVLGFPVITEYFQAVGKTEAVIKALGEIGKTPHKERLSEIFEYQTPTTDSTETVGNKIKKNRGLTRRTALTVLTAVGGVLILRLTALKGDSFADSEKNKAVPSSAPLPTKTPETINPQEINLISELAKPLAEYAFKQRQIREETDPEYLKRVDKEANGNRVNILMFGYGEEHQDTYEDYGGSISIFSLDLKTNQITSFSLSRDILTPELTQIVEQQTGKKQPTEIRRVFKTGIDQSGNGDKNSGFKLMREITEKMTGLSIDLQLVAKDTIIRDFISQVTGPLLVDVDKRHETGPYKIDRVAKPEGIIEAGSQPMDADKAMQFVLAEDKNPQGRQDERSYRKSVLMESIIKSLVTKFKEGNGSKLAAPLINFLTQQTFNKSIEYDFDLNLITSTLASLVDTAAKAAASPSGFKIEGPEEISPKDKRIAIHDPFFGDGSVRRIHNIRNHSGNPQTPDNPTVEEEAKRGIYPDWMLVPDGGNPYSTDLITDYWGSIRKLVRAKLGLSALKTA